jgi:hypothetical protein
MSNNNDYTIETLRLQTPEEMGRGRMLVIEDSVNNIAEVLRKAGIRADQEQIHTEVPKSQEVSNYKVNQEANVVSEADSYTKKAAAELFEDRARQNALDAFTGYEQNPLFDLEDSNA